MAEEKRYAVLSSVSILQCANATGITDLPADVASALAEDASYRVREIINKSSQFMKHARRIRLSATDVMKALHFNHVTSTIGENHAEDPHYDTLNEGDFHILEDDPVNLHDIALDNYKGREMIQPTFSSSWYIVNGSLYTGNASDENVTVSDTLLEYFNTSVTCILGSDKALRQETLKDLCVNPKIFPLIPYFVTFISNVKAVSHDLQKLSVLLQTVSALTLNPYMNFMGFLKPLVSSVLYCVLEPLAASINLTNDHWLLRDYGARLLAFIADRHSHTHTKDIVKYIRESVKNILSDPTRPLCSHYGSIVTITALGIPAIRTMLCPNLLSYYDLCLRSLLEEDTDCNNVHLKSDIHKVVGVIIDALEKMYFEVFENGLQNSDYTLLTQLFSLFGDSLFARLPLLVPNMLSSSQTRHDYASKTKDQSRKTKPLQKNYNSPSTLQYYGPIIKKPLFLSTRRLKSINLSEMFRPTRIQQRKLNIGSMGNLTLSRQKVLNAPYSHSPYFRSVIKTAFIGKSKSLLRKTNKRDYYNYLSLAL